MKSYIMVVLAVALFGAIVVAEAGEEGEGGCKGMMMNLTCLGEPMNKEAMMKGKKECQDEMKGSAEEEWKNYLCLKVCQWKKKGILNADGDFNSAGAATFAKSLVVSEKVADVVSAAMASCASKIGDKATRMDNNCAGYKEVKACEFEEVMGKACGNEKMVQEMKEKMEKWKKEKESKQGN